MIDEKTVRELTDEGFPRCPHCGEEEDIDRGWPDYDGNESRTMCRCGSCDKEWQEMHAATGIAVRNDAGEWWGIVPVWTVDKDDLQKLLALADAVESVHVVYANPAAEEAIRQGIEAAKRLKEVPRYG